MCMVGPVFWPDALTPASHTGIRGNWKQVTISTRKQLIYNDHLIIYLLETCDHLLHVRDLTWIWIKRKAYLDTSCCDARHFICRIQQRQTYLFYLFFDQLLIISASVNFSIELSIWACYTKKHRCIPTMSYIYVTRKSDNTTCENSSSWFKSFIIWKSKFSNRKKYEKEHCVQFYKWFCLIQ